MDDLWGNAWGDDSRATPPGNSNENQRKVPDSPEEVDIAAAPSWHLNSTPSWEPETSADIGTSHGTPSWNASADKPTASWSLDDSPWGTSFNAQETTPRQGTPEPAAAESPQPVSTPPLEQPFSSSPPPEISTFPNSESQNSGNGDDTPETEPEPKNESELTVPHSEPLLASPDAFGSFETGDNGFEEEASWSSAAHESSEPPDAAWGSVWEGRKEAEEPIKDEWAAAQELEVRRNQRVPRELVESLIAQWSVLENEIWPRDSSSPMKVGTPLEDLDHISYLLTSLLPSMDVGLPVTFSKTAIYRQQHLALKLSKNLRIAHISPFAHISMVKNNDAWEASVRTHIEVNPEQLDLWATEAAKGSDVVKSNVNAYPAPPPVERKQSGWSFWGKKGSTPSLSRTASTADDSMDKRPSPVTSSPRVSMDKFSPRPSSDRPSSERTTQPVQTGSLPPSRPSSTLPNPSLPIPSPITAIEGPAVPRSKPLDFFSDEEDDTKPGQPAPSAVTRFLSRFSRGKNNASDSSASKRQSLALSSNDLQFLSDVPSLVDDASSEDQLSSLQNVLSSPVLLTGKTPPRLAPPPVSPALPAAQNAPSALLDIMSDEVFGSFEKPSLGSIAPMQSTQNALGAFEDLLASPAKSGSTLSSSVLPSLLPAMIPTSGPPSRTDTPGLSPSSGAFATETASQSRMLQPSSPPLPAPPSRGNAVSLQPPAQVSNSTLDHSNGSGWDDFDDFVTSTSRPTEKPAPAPQTHAPQFAGLGFGTADFVGESSGPSIQSMKPPPPHIPLKAKSLEPDLFSVFDKPSGPSKVEPPPTPTKDKFTPIINGHSNSSARATIPPPPLLPPPPSRGAMSLLPPPPRVNNAHASISPPLIAPFDNAPNPSVGNSAPIRPTPPISPPIFSSPSSASFLQPTARNTPPPALPAQRQPPPPSSSAAGTKGGLSQHDLSFFEGL